MKRRESDSLVVPMKAGNAAGGKEATHGTQGEETPSVHGSGEGRWPQNWTVC